jgi:uncharacterized protein (DUF433 family)
MAAGYNCLGMLETAQEEQNDYPGLPRKNIKTAWDCLVINNKMLLKLELAMMILRDTKARM